MQERHHVKTIPGEAAVPEVVSHPVRKEPGGNVQMDDINIPIVAVTVAFFAVLLAVVIVSLQAWFYSAQAAERASKISPQGSPETWLGAIVIPQRAELQESGPVHETVAGGTTGPATTTVTRYRMPIGDAMKIIQQQYAGGQNR
jgi:hypothetical protein